jgi:hypothetical protein
MKTWELVRYFMGFFKPFRVTRPLERCGTGTRVRSHKNRFGQHDCLEMLLGTDLAGFCNKTCNCIYGCPGITPGIGRWEPADSVMSTADIQNRSFVLRSSINPAGPSSSYCHSELGHGLNLPPMIRSWS